MWITDEQFDERGGVDAGTLQIMGEGKQRDIQAPLTLLFMPYMTMKGTIPISI